jgi:hypothetical protein
MSHRCFSEEMTVSMTQAIGYEHQMFLTFLIVSITYGQREEADVFSEEMTVTTTRYISF